MTRRAFLGPVLAGAGGVLLVLAVIALSPLGDARDPEAGTESTLAAFPLDRVPGFGKGDSAALRDDAIAVWETFAREALISQCMQNAHFSYTPDLRSEDSDLKQVGHFLGVAVDPDRAVDGGPANEKVQESLGDMERDRYFLTLFGVSSRDLEQGRGDIDDVGCYADSRREVGSLWILRQDLAPELVALTKSINTSSAAVAAQERFSGCAEELGVSGVKNQADLEVAGVDPATADAVVESCGPGYDQALREERLAQEEAFVKQHPELQVQIDRYAEARQQMLNDKAFLDAIGAE